jgi:hypothetical protein
MLQEAAARPAIQGDFPMREGLVLQGDFPMKEV